MKSLILSTPIHLDVLRCLIALISSTNEIGDVGRKSEVAE
jgi:hypothetical protein